MSKKTHRHIDLSNLPTNKSGKIDWKNIKNNKIYFEYGEINGYMLLIKCLNDMVEVEYNNDNFNISTSNIRDVSFGKILNVFTKEFKVEIDTTFENNKRNITITDREYRPNVNGTQLKWYKYKCHICGYDGGWIEESHLLGKSGGCSCCYGKTVVKGINDISTTNPELVKFFVNIEDVYENTSSSHKRVEVKCADCGRVRKNKMSISEINRYNSIGCYCSDGKSYPEKFVFNIFEQLNVNFITEFSKRNECWCGKYSYDFYNPNLNMIIEAHGEQHYRDTGFKIRIEDQREIDAEKERIAIENGVKVYIQLDCRFSTKDYIKNSVLNSELIKYFNFNNVDWDKADEFATKNLIKTVCEYYERHKEDVLKKDISDKFKIDTSTLTKYLHKGNKLGWCNYSKYNEKTKIKVVETGEVFNGIRECCRFFKENYNINLNNGSVSRVLNGGSKTHKGYSFEYTTSQSYLKPKETDIILNAFGITKNEND